MIKCGYDIMIIVNEREVNKMGKIGVYSGKALETEEKIKGDISAYYTNKVYKNTNYNIYWFINQRGYLHVLRPSNVTMNGKIIGYAINDYMLTKDNMLDDKGIVFQADTQKEIADRLEEMCNE